MGLHKYFSISLMNWLLCTVLLHFTALTGHWPGDSCTLRCWWPTYEFTWASSRLCCASQTAWPACPWCAAHSSQLQNQLSQLILTQKSAGSSPLAPAITPPARSCLYLIVRMMNRAVFLKRNPLLPQKTNQEYPVLQTRCYVGIMGLLNAQNSGCPVPKVMLDYLC